MTRVVTVGDAMVVMVAETGVPLRAARRFTRSVAGAEVNVAVGLARMGHEARWIGRVGDDPLGDIVVSTLRADGVDVSAVARDDLPTGLMIRDALGDRPVEVVYHRVHAAGSRLSVDDLPDDLVDADLLHVTGITGLVSSSARAAVREAVRRARTAGVTVTVDPNLRWTLGDREHVLEVSRDLVADADIVLAGEEEMAAMTGHPAGRRTRDLLDRGAKVVVTKLAAGARAETSSETIRATVPRGPVVDPVGAGDAFDAAFLDAWLRDLPLETALERGCRAGALVAGVPTDLDGLPRAGWTSNVDGEVQR